MTTYFVYHASADTMTLWGMPSTADIVAATRGDAVNSFLAGAGGSVRLAGPTPRIVRSTTLGSLTSGYHTDVAELIEVDGDPSGAQSAAQTLADTITQQLQASDSSWQTGTITPWDAATNGSVAWWECTAGSSPESCASVTMTRDNIQQGAARTTPDENPIGPTTSASHPGSILPSLPSASDITSWMWIAAIGVGLYVFWPLIVQAIGEGRAKAAARAASRAPTRRNPRLTYARKKALPRSAFAIPEQRKYPLVDAAHARNALARVSRFGSRSQQRRVCAAVHERFPNIHARSCPFH